MRTSWRIAAGTTLGAIILSGCSAKAAQPGEQSSTGDVRTDVGVTDSEIHIAALTDLSGPFKTNGLAYTAGNKIWAADVNERGGICGRDIVLNVGDTGYKPDNAVSLYETMRTTNLSLIQLVGSPVIAALKQRLTNDQVLTTLGVGSSILLDTESLLLVSQTYDIETINGLAYLEDEGLLADGDKIAAVYIDNEGGQNMLTGVQAYAAEHDLDVVDVAIAASDTDLTATVTKLRGAGVTAIAMTTSAAAASSLAIQAKAQGLDVPIIATTPVFAPTMVSDPATAAALDRFYLLTSFALYGTGGELMSHVQSAYEQSFDEQPDRSIPVGYVSGLALEAVLEQACEDGDLTRAGLLAARKKVTALDTQGLTGTLDLSDPGAPGTREAFVMKIDPKSPVGLSVVRDKFMAPEAADYRTPHQR